MEKKKKISIELEKIGKKEKQKIWVDIAKRIVKPNRTLPKVNLWKINILAKKLQKKTIVVPGHVLGEGKLDDAFNIAALSFSKKATQKIADTNGRVFSLPDLAKSGQKTSEMVIVK
ncbi:MAG: 50S ribosomal protein L18e [Candidatus Diapherotrites archaeon]|nr:50S ribosomal protein L18e [Candidatus Diapherotrites archaeon]